MSLIYKANSLNSLLTPVLSGMSQRCTGNNLVDFQKTAGKSLLCIDFIQTMMEYPLLSDIYPLDKNFIHLEMQFNASVCWFIHV